MTKEEDIIKVAETGDTHFKNVHWTATAYLAWDEGELMQLWECKNTGQTEWRPLPDLEQFCDEHGISPGCP